MWVQHETSRPQAGCLVAIGAPATISPLMTRPANAGAVVAAHTWVCHCNLYCRLPEAVPSGAHPHLGRMGEGACHYRTPNAPLGAHIPGRTQAAHAPAAVAGWPPQHRPSHPAAPAGPHYWDRRGGPSELVPWEPPPPALGMGGPGTKEAGGRPRAEPNQFMRLHAEAARPHTQGRPSHAAAPAAPCYSGRRDAPPGSGSVGSPPPPRPAGLDGPATDEQKWPSGVHIPVREPARPSPFAPAGSVRPHTQGRPLHTAQPSTDTPQASRFPGYGTVFWMA